jgi:threonine aldolase
VEEKQGAIENKAVPYSGSSTAVRPEPWNSLAGTDTLRKRPRTVPQPETKMPDAIIDLRSDTVTQPTAAMRQAMANAEVGDDVLGADPTTKRLEATVAAMLGKAAAIFMPSGTMTNQVAIRLHCQPGDEFLCDQDCHIYYYEQGAFAQLSGVVAHTVAGAQGVLEVNQLEPLIRPENVHFVRTRLLCLENTHNRGGGRVLPFDAVQAVCDWAHARGLRTHLDGARLFNAVTASGIAADRWASLFDTVSVCFSKGLGAPVGSALAGSEDLINAARRHRKVLGGGMRQSGIIAAGALHALENHVGRLADDHQLAQQLARAIRAVDGLSLVYDQVDTNIVFFDLEPRLGTAAQFLADLREAGVLMLAESSQRIRALTHLDVSPAQIRRAIEVLEQVAARRRSART